MKITSLKGLTKEQERIYQGLLQIGDLLASFYIDAILILREQCMLQTKVNLVAHCAREIDGGLREIFAPDKEKLSMEATLSGKNKGHYASILVALGNSNTIIADEWIDVGKQFHGLAHRHQSWLKPKHVSEVSELWARYEKILSILTGSVYAIKDRIDQLTKIDIPTPDIIGALRNLNKGRQNEFQFFKNLDKPDWLKPLNEAGAFDIDNHEPVYDQEGRQVLIDWLPLRYLANIAEIATMRKEKLIIEIIDTLKKRVIAGDLFIDDYCVYMIYKTLGGLPNYVFGQSDIDLLNTYYDYAPYGQFPLHESFLLDTLVDRYVNKGEKEGLMTLLVFCFGFRNKEVKIVGFEDHGFFAQNKVSSNLNSATHHHVIDGLFKQIIEITGPELLYKLTSVITELAKVQSYELNSIPSVEVSGQTEMYMHDWVANIIQFVRNGAELLQKEELISFVHHLLYQEPDILRRLAVHLIRLNYGDAGYLLWDWIAAIRLQGYFNIHELYLLIQKISPSLSLDGLKKLVEWIEQMQYESPHYKLEELERFKTHRIRTYLSAFKSGEPAQSKYLKERDEHYLKFDAWPLEHPEFDTYSTSSIGYDIPIRTVELESMTVPEQVEYMASLKQKDDFDTSTRGLALLLNNAIIGNPAKYEAELPEILKLRDIYLEQVISSFGWVVKNGTLSGWYNLVSKIEQRLLNDADAQDELKDYEQTLAAFAELLIQLADLFETYKFSLTDLDYLINLSSKLLLVEFPDELTEIPKQDYITQRLNSLWGKAFDAMIAFNRIWANHSDNHSSEKINKAIYNFLEPKLNKPECTAPGFFVNVGWHFPYLLSVAPEWCAKNSALLFPEKDEYRMGLVIDNLLSPYQQVYKNVLVYLNDQHLNSFLVNRKYNDESGFNRVCRYALTELNYLDGKAIEKDGTLINLILANGNADQYKSLITVTLQNKDGNEPAMITLWEYIQNKVRGFEKEYESILSYIGGLVLVSGISPQTLDLLDRSLQYLQNEPVTYQLTGLLFRKFELAPVRIGEMILKIWNQTKLRVMVTEDLSGFIEKLYAQGFKSLADELCIFVAAQGNYELKIVYDKYQVKDLPPLTEV
jgi:hypothetical protein